MSIEENTEKAPVRQAKPEKKLWADIDYQEIPDSHTPYTTQPTPVQVTPREPVKTVRNPRRSQHATEQTQDFSSNSNSNSYSSWGHSQPHIRPTNQPQHQSFQSPKQRHGRASPHQRRHERQTTPQTQQDTELIRNQPAIMSENAAKKAEEIRQRNAREEEERRLNCLRLLKQLDEKKHDTTSKTDESAPVIKKEESAPATKTEESAPAIKKDESEGPATQSIEFRIPLRSSAKKKPPTPPRTTTAAANESEAQKPISPAPSDTEIIFKVPITRDTATEAAARHKPQTKQHTPQMIYRRKQDAVASSDAKTDPVPPSPATPAGGDVIVQEMRIRIAPNRPRSESYRHRPRSAVE